MFDLYRVAPRCYLIKTKEIQARRTIMFTKVIFAIDNNNNTHNVAKFLRHVDTLRAMGKIKSQVTQCIGNWEGILEVSYMMDLADYDSHVAGKGYTEGQECILIVPGDVRQPCTLRFPCGDVVAVGKMIEIPAPVGNWTYVPTTGKYFTTEQG
jgi:hypothetical protein